MSCCEIIPNNSVHWVVTHEDLAGAAKTRPTRPKSSPPRDTTDTVTVEARRVVGVDSIAPGDIGYGGKHGGVPKNHGGHFRVTLRFETELEARNAATLAMSKIAQQAGSDLWNLVLDVRAIPTTRANAGLNSPNPYAQVCVIW